MRRPPRSTLFAFRRQRQMCIRDRPYKQWIENLRIKLGSVGSDTHAGPEAASLPLLERQQAFGFTQ
ncbi:hypothetical protein, partial [Delftia sp. ASV31]|uniref:hypothetical protein n=1 Tax=Delftia sp. ASV31 TaxID=2795113 RepID=UPI0035AC0A17